MNWSWAIAIEGLMRRGIASVHPLGLVAADPTGTYPEGNVFGGTVACLSGVRLSSHSVAPVSGDLASQSLDCLIDLRDPDVASFFFADAEPIGELTFGVGAGISLTTNGVNITLASGLPVNSAIATNSVIYVGREAFRVASAGEAGVTVASVCPAGAVYPAAGSDNDVTRTDQPAGSMGHGFTSMRAHPARTGGDEPAPFPDGRVYVVNPVLARRRVFLYRVGVTGAGEVIQQLAGQYLIDADTLATGSDGLSLSFSASALTSAKGAQINRRPVEVAARYGLGPSGDAALVSAGPFSRTADSLYVQRGKPYATRAVYDVGGKIATVIVGDTAVVGIIATQAGGTVDPGSTFGTEPLSASAEIQDATMREVLVSDPFDVARSSAAASVPMVASTHPYYDANAGAVARNPVVMVLQHLGAVPSNLPTHWRVSLGADAVDVTGMLQAAGLVAVDRWPGVVAGQDGRPIDALSWMYETFLRPIGLGWGVNQHGQLTVRSLSQPELAPTATVGQSLALYGRAMERATGASADAVIGKMRGVIVTNTEAYLPDDDDTGVVVYEIAADAATNPNESAALDSPTVQAVRAWIGSLAGFLGKGVRRARISVSTAAISAMRADGIYDLLPGQLVTLSLRGMRDPATGLLSQEVTDATAVIIEHAWGSDFASQEITAIVLPYAVRRYAPTVRVVSVVDDGGGAYTLTVSAADTVSPAPFAPLLPPTAPLDRDADALGHGAAIVGGAVVILDGVLEVRGTATLGSASDVTVTITGATAAPVAGDTLALSTAGGIFAEFPDAEMTL